MPTTEPITEWTFVGDVQSLINEIIRDHPELPFSEAKIEERGRGQRKRRDLTLYDRNGRCALSGEVKLPDKPDGRTPYAYGVASDAHDKADRAGIEYFFTWNVNRFVLWKTFDRDTSIIERDYLYWDVTEIRESSELAHPRVRQQIRNFLEHFLESYARIYTGEQIVRARPLDERFIHILESALERPVAQTLFAISQGYAHSARFKAQLDRWMRDQQGWLLADDEEVIRDNLERAAKFSCYVLVNKIVFHTALRRRFRRLKKIRVPTTLSTVDHLQRQLVRHFEEAKILTRDYETVFDGDFGDTLPFLNDAAVDSWRELVNQIEGFDFTQLDYDIIGHIFERLISPEERHRYGQHYTKTEIVDLINAFCIRDPKAHVLDPACGGGTFLVRAYARKRYLADREPEHAELLEQIKGIDISAYPVHLSTINLATRQLVDTRNYPLVARSDFFDVKPDLPVFHIPFGPAGRGGRQTTFLQVGKVDAVIGNPPYVRQEEIGKPRKEKIVDLIQQEFPRTQLSKRSDIFVYFFPHAAAFLRGPGAYVGLLTSIGWLDTDYGFRLQKFFLDRFRIIAVLESSCEPWFTGARVTTAVTILQREPDAEKRLKNFVRFVQIRKPLKELYPENGDSRERLERAEELRDFIENCTQDYADDRWRIRVISQEELYRQGCWQTTEEEKDEEPEAEQVEHLEMVQGQELPPYAGGKWGVYLRAPDIFFELLDRYRDAFTPLREIADIRRGITSGCDDFFFVEDITDQALHEEPTEAKFRSRYGISRRHTNRIRVVRAGDASVHTVEAEYLEPEVHSLMEIDSVEIDPNSLRRKALLVSEPRRKLRRTHVGRYIRWGERQAFHERPTCAARDPWYDLRPTWRGEILWAKAHQYRHVAALNSKKLLCNCNLYNVRSKQRRMGLILAAVLNSSLVALSKHQFGRYMGREGNLKTEVLDVEMMLVPDIRRMNQPVSQRLNEALESLRKRKALPLSEEFELRDRQQLDDAVLELIGVRQQEERARLRDTLYGSMRQIYKETRKAELKMQVLRRRMARRGKLTPRSIAQDIWESFDKIALRHFPYDFIPDETQVEYLDLAPAKKVRLIDDLFQKGALRANGHTYALRHPDRAQFAARVLEEGHSGRVAIPTQPGICARAVSEHDKYRTDTQEAFRERVAEYTADEEWQDKIAAELWKLHGANRD